MRYLVHCALFPHWQVRQCPWSFRLASFTRSRGAYRSSLTFLLETLYRLMSTSHVQEIFVETSSVQLPHLSYKLNERA